MKRIYIFGRVIRIAFLIAFAFLIYAFFDMYIQSSFSFFNLMLLLFVVAVAIYVLIWMYSFGIFIDNKNNTIKIITGFSSNNRRERSLSDIKSVDVELNGNIGMTFIIQYIYNSTERIEYKFYRISFLEKSQYKRIKKQLVQLINSNLSNRI